MSAEPLATVTGTFQDDNLRPFLEIVAAFVGYAFDEDDWTAIRFGVRDTVGERGLWYDYSLPGSHSAHVKVAYDEDPGTGVIMFRVDVPPALVPKMEAARDIVERFKLT